MFKTTGFNTDTEQWRLSYGSDVSDYIFKVKKKEWYFINIVALKIEPLSAVDSLPLNYLRSKANKK